ncbi:hypothetical protein ABIE21_000546 [Conyzicola nivalis]|uniref:DUF4337 domain-containing protein n=1 Tax=Conyzicola nivalis TaxID=1477021 RepID=A0ABV2QJ45_9MICO
MHEPVSPEPAITAHAKSGRGDEVREIIAVVLLSLTAILTAWCGFESSKWSGQMSIQFSEASSARIRSIDFASEARDARSVDLAIYTQWVDAKARQDEAFATYVSNRFTPEFTTAFDDWVQGGEQLKSPFAEPSYVPAGEVESRKASKLADAKFALALQSNQRGDNYSMLTVMFALVLFFAAIAERATSRWSSWFLICLAGLVSLGGVAVLASFPVLF